MPHKDSLMFIFSFETSTVSLDVRSPFATECRAANEIEISSGIDSPLVRGVVDLCCGMGGLSEAARSLGLVVCAGVDTNATAIRTFGKNFPSAEAIQGSVRSDKVLDQCKEAVLAKT